MIGRHRVQILPRRKLLSGPECVIPAAAHHPLPCLEIAEAVPNALLELGKGARAVEFHLKLRLARASEMDVSIIEAGHGELAAQINDSRPGPDPWLQISAGIRDGGNPLAANRNGGSPWVFAIARINPAIREEEIRRILRGRALQGTSFRCARDEKTAR